MKATAIVYTSNTGFTAQYAAMLGQETGLPVYELRTASRDLPHGTPIAYLGWLCAGKVKKLDQAEKCWAISAVCAVGMGPDATQVETLKNSYPGVFYLRGGYDRTKVKGMYRLMMGMMGKILASKGAADEQGQEMLDAVTKGANWVSLEQLTPVIDYIKE